MLNLRFERSSHPAGYLLALGQQHNTLPMETTARIAVWTYTLYKAHNYLRYHPDFNTEHVPDLLKQYCFQGVSGHAGALKLLRGTDFSHLVPIRREHQEDNTLDGVDEELFE